MDLLADELPSLRGGGLALGLVLEGAFPGLLLRHCVLLCPASARRTATTGPAASPESNAGAAQPLARHGIESRVKTSGGRGTRRAVAAAELVAIAQAEAGRRARRDRSGGGRPPSSSRSLRPWPADSGPRSPVAPGRAECRAPRDTWPPCAGRCAVPARAGARRSPCRPAAWPDLRRPDTPGSSP